MKTGLGAWGPLSPLCIQRNYKKVFGWPPHPGRWAIHTGYRSFPRSF